MYIVLKLCSLRSVLAPTLQLMFSDSSPKATPTRDAFHPKPVEYGVHLPAWIGACRGLHHQGPEDPTPTRCIQMLTVPDGLHACMEVGEESIKR